MKLTYKIILINIFLFLHPCICQTNFWQATSGPRHIVHSLFRYTNGTVFTACDSNVFYSTNNGANWITPSGLSQSNYSAFTKAPNGDIFCGNSDGNVFWSTDGGINWTQVKPGIFAVGIFSLASNSFGHIFAASMGLDRTTNNGGSWTGLSISGSELAYSIVIDSIDGIYVGTDNGIFKSTNNGNDWIPCGGDFSGTSFYSLAIDNVGGIFACINGNKGKGLFYSTDQGTTWNIRSSGLPGWVFNEFALNSNKHLFVAAGDSGVYRSKDNGKSWTKINTGLSSRASSLLLEPNGFLQVGTLSGVFRSLQSTTLFSFQKDSLFYDTVKVGQSLIDSVYVINNGTETLNITSVSSSIPDFSVTPNSNSLSVGQKMWFKITFTPKHFGTISGTIQFISNANTSPDELHISGIGKAPYLQFGGKDYSIGRTLLNNSKDSLITFSNIGNDILIISSIFIADGHFSLRPTSVQILPGQSFTDTIRFTPTELGEISTKAIFTSNSISSPDTLLIKGIGYGIPRIIFSMSQVFFGRVPIGSFKDTIISINNSGNDTLKINTIHSSNSAFNIRYNNIPLAPGQTRVDTLRFAPTTKDSISALIVYKSNSATTEDTIYVSGIGDSTITGITLTNANSIRFKLSQNYPNPFNPSTKIIFEIPEDGLVTIKIYNLLGQEVHFLLNKRLSQGEHSVVWNASSYPSGIYFYRLQYGSITEARKLLYIR